MKNLERRQGKIFSQIMGGPSCAPCKCIDPCGKCFMGGIEIYDHALIKSLKGGYSLSSTVSSSNFEGRGYEPNNNIDY